MEWVWPLFANAVSIELLPGTTSTLAEITLARLKLQSQLDHEADFTLQFTPECVQLAHRKGREAPLKVDFTAGAVDHRRKFGGGRGQDIAKALGLHKGATPRVLDATAGLGRDAFTLASLGCHVDMLERSPVVYALLVDGHARALQAVSEVSEIAHRMTVFFGSLLDGAIPHEEVDVIYLDPMFPERQKSALVKKDMRFFHSVVGDDADAGALLEAALAVDCARVVVKRPLKAPFLDEQKPSHQIIGKTIRYDIYVKRKLN
jgi:16S rRNA (guanine1516-N2)-methyltransferase